MDDGMTLLPFVVHNARILSEPYNPLTEDVPTAEDPLPAPIGAESKGYIRARETRITQVRNETLDDN